MIEVKLVMALMNREGWDPVEGGNASLPEFYRPGRPLVDYVLHPFLTRLKILGEKNFDDKLLIFREAMSAYLAEFPDAPSHLLTTYAEVLYRPVSKGAYRGVLVVVLQNMGLLDVAISRNWTNIQISDDLWDVELDQAPEEAQPTRQVLEEGTLPPAPGALPTLTLDDVVSVIDRFVEADPSRAVEVLERCREIADRHRPLDTRRVLGMADAVRITGRSEPRIKQLAREGKIGEKRGSRWAFSEEELVLHSETARPAGRPPKKPGP